jgi:hypothetical protein
MSDVHIFFKLLPTNATRLADALLIKVFIIIALAAFYIH